MSAETIEEDSLISQTDVDSFLKSSSIEDAEEKFQAMRTTLWMI